MLSAYELNNHSDPTLLAQTEILANKLVYAWEDENPVPYSAVNFHWDEPFRQVVSYITLEPSQSNLGITVR